jgi:hypothetical protein
MTRRALAVAAGVLGAVPLAAAHHSTALVYHRDGPIVEAEGVITEVAWVNPHVRFKLRGRGPDGVERSYEIESNSVSTVSRFGLTAGLVAAGTRVKVAGNGGRQSDSVLWLTNMLLPSGEEILFGAAVKPRWSDRTIGTDIRSAVAADTELGLYRVWTNTTNPVAFWGEGLPLTPSAAATQSAFDPVRDEPTANCVPKGMPFVMEQPYPMQFVAAGDEILMKMEEYDTVRHIALDESAASAGREPNPLGISRGRWEGRTLVVTTTDVTYRHFNGTGIPLGPAAQFEERFTLSADGSRLDYVMTVTDSATFLRPVTLRKAWEYRPGEALKPYECRL